MIFGTGKENLEHPKKAHRTDRGSARKPNWIRVKLPTSPEYGQVRRLTRELGLHTVCEEAACPNIGECWAKRHATLLIMGDVCTRACAFCNVSTGKPAALDPDEPVRVGEAVARLKLDHVVITSVDRDDLNDGGAAHFCFVVASIREYSPGTTIEILTPDFRNKLGAAEVIAATPPDVFNHNLETVPRLYPTIRPGARYFTSLALLHEMKRRLPERFTKSGIMVGLGEDRGEVLQVMDDLRAAKVDFITIGQYLQPTPKHAPIENFVTPEAFDEYAAIGRAKGFLMVASSPLTRSSYHAGEDFQHLRTVRANELVGQ